MTTDFYATRSELIDLFADFERQVDVKYASSARSETRPADLVLSLADAKLGMHYGVSGEDTLMIFPKDEAVTIKEIPPFRRLPRCYVITNNDKRVVTLIPGGEFGGLTVILGSIVSFPHRGWSRDMGRLLRQLIKQRWRQSQWLWVSPGAESLWRSGWRLTSDIKHGTDLDFLP